jgi:hypothetical protein
MAEPAEGLRSELESLVVARRSFPIWTDWGVADESHTVHSLGLSYLVRVGQELGMVAACEYPVAGHHVRADAVWWDPATRDPVAIFEFERLKDGAELIVKVRNLMRAWHATGRKPAALVLVFWQKAFFAGSRERVAGLWREFELGYRDEVGAFVGPVPTRLLYVYECLHSDLPGGGHTLKRFKEWRRT